MIDQFAIGIKKVEQKIADCSFCREGGAVNFGEEAELKRRGAAADAGQTEQGHLHIPRVVENRCKATAFDQGLTGFGAVDNGGGRQQIAIGTDGLGELPGKFGGVEPASFNNAAQQRNHFYAPEIAGREGLQGLVQGMSPTHTEDEIIRELISCVHARCHADGLADICRV